jgi:hypothetical protein
MNSFTEHPEVIAHHEILRKNEYHNTPHGIFTNNIRRLNDEFIPNHPKNAIKREGGEELSMNSYSRTL